MEKRLLKMDQDSFIAAYWKFRETVELDKTAGLPDLNHLVWCLLAGMPDVPADEEDGPDAPFKAVDQRVAILKAVFVEVHKEQDDTFLDEALNIYDEAARLAKLLIKEAGTTP